MKEKANKNNIENQQSNGEIATIRNILMGQFMAESDSSFGDLRNELGETDARINKKIDALESAMNTRFSNLEASIDERFSKLAAKTTKSFEDLETTIVNRFEVLEDKLSKTTIDLEGRINDISKRDKANLGEMLAQLSSSLINNK